MKNKNIAIVPGSFDPITVGHINIVKRAMELYDKVYLAVMINPEKEYMFTISQREAIAKAALSDIEGVEVVSSDGMLWELAKKLGARAIVKGYRNETDLAYEKKMADFNSDHYPDAQTLLLMADDSLSDISSTIVREMITNNEPLDKLVPKSAISEINKIMSKQ